MNRRQFISAAAAVVVAFILAAAPAMAKTNFSGEWKMNAEKSDFGPMPAPEKMSQKVEHADPNLKITSNQVGAQGEVTLETKYTTDGKECINTIRGNEMKSTAKWDGETLVIN